MIEKLEAHLQSEIKIFEATIKLEKEKQMAILKARGKDLQELNRESESCIQKLADLGVRQIELRKELMVNTDASNLEEINLTYIARQGEGKLDAVVEEYRRLALKLKAETEENHRLLERTGASIDTLIQGLKSVAVAKDRPAYAPHNSSGQSGRKSSGAVLVNANA